MKEKGLFVNLREFKSDEDIRREFALNNQPIPVFHDPKKTRGVQEYLSSAKKRATDMKELSPIHDTAKISLPHTSTIHIMSDVHVGNPNTDTQRFGREIEAIKNTSDNYILFTGDIVDGVFWGGEGQAEQSLNKNEQYGFLRSLFTSLKGKIIAGVSGEHDSKWASKTGSDPYEIMEEITDAPYLRGVAEIEIDVKDQEYKIVAQHKARGHSMYNKNHPTYRESRFDVQGADIYISAHTHRKQVSQEAVRHFGGAKKVTHISTGSYKTGDEYGDRNGFAKQKPEEMYGASLRLHEDKKQVDVEYDILEAIRKWK